MRPRSIVASGALLGILTHPVLALASPSKEECVAANEQGQALLQRGSLQSSREQFVMCLAEGCPGPVRQDCADRLAEIDHATPTFVFEVTDSAGHELTDVTLRVDGAIVAERFAGRAVAIDPGSHQLVFSSASGYALAESIVAHEAQKDRRERVVLLPVSTQPSPQRLVGLTAMGVGVAGLVVGGVLGIVAKSTYDTAIQNDCGGDAKRCTPTGVSQISSAHAQAAGATAGIVAGAAVAAGGVVLWATARHDVRIQPAVGGGTLALGGTF